METVQNCHKRGRKKRTMLTSKLFSKCGIEGECFAKNKDEQCTLLTETPRKKCGFKKTQAEFDAGREKYGDGRSYVCPHKGKENKDD